jgi:hypothetical protein
VCHAAHEDSLVNESVDEARDLRVGQSGKSPANNGILENRAKFANRRPADVNGNPIPIEQS